MTTPSKRNDDRLPTLVPVFRDRWFDPLRSPMARKALVIVGGALIIAAVALQWSGRDGVSLAGIPALLVVIVLNLTTRVMADAAADELDERMVAVRNAAFRGAYYVLATGAVAALAIVIATGGSDEIMMSRAQLLGTAWCVAVTAMFLPSAILAWTEEVV